MSDLKKIYEILKKLNDEQNTEVVVMLRYDTDEKGNGTLGVFDLVNARCKGDNNMCIGGGGLSGDGLGDTALFFEQFENSMMSLPEDIDADSKGCYDFSPEHYYQAFPISIEGMKRYNDARGKRNDKE